jgi:hypothetical protein
MNWRGDAFSGLKDTRERKEVYGDGDEKQEISISVVACLPAGCEICNA